MSGAAHKALVARVCAANPTAKTVDFWPTLARHLVAESGDVTHGDYVDDVLDGPYSVSSSEFERQYLGAVARYVAEHSGPRILPDAFQFDDRTMTIVVWEVSVTNSMRKSEDKWFPLALEIDNYDEWTVAVVSVDVRGLCSYTNPATEETVTWLVDQSCPIDWTRGVKFTERSRNSGTPKALAKSMAGIRLSHDNHRLDIEEAAE